MSILDGILISGTTYQKLDRGFYIDTAATVGGTSDTIRITPGSLRSPANGEPYMSTTFVVTREFDIATPSEGSSSRQKVTVRLEIKSGLDVSLTDIQSAIDAVSEIPDSNRLTPILLGAA